MKKPAPTANELNDKAELQSPKPNPQPAAKPASKVAALPKAAAPKQPPKQKPSPEKKPSELRKPLQEAFQVASAINGGDKALLTAVSLELRKRVPGFAVKSYGEKTFAKLVGILGYRIDKNWCFPQKK